MSILTRVMGAETLNAEFAFLDKPIANNGYDNKYPWNSMEIIVDSYGNHWLEIPIFYTKYDIDVNGYITARYISEYQVDETKWHLNPIFIDENGNKRQSIQISCYQLSIDNNGMPVSVPNATVSTGVAIKSMRSKVSNYNTKNDGYDYRLYDIWTHILIQDLFLVEFANSNIAEVMPGYNYDNYKIKLLKTGTTDTIISEKGIEFPISGIACKSNERKDLYAMKYRSLENIVGNGHLILDNIFFNGEEITVSNNGKTATSSIDRISEQGLVSKLTFDSTTKLVFPVKTSAKGGYGDQYRGSTGTNEIMIIGYNDVTGYGLFSYGFISAAAQDEFGTYRMVRYSK